MEGLLVAIGEGPKSARTVCVDLGAQGPRQGLALGDERPARAEAEQADTLVTRARAEQVANKVVTAVVRKADDRDGGEEREGVLGNPFPAEDRRKHDPEVAAAWVEIMRTEQLIIESNIPLLVVKDTAEVQTLEQVDNRDVARVERAKKVALGFLTSAAFGRDLLCRVYQE